MIVETETGSVYEFDVGKVRRIEHTHDLRRDGEWVGCTIAYGPVVGDPMVLALEPLSDTASFTVRRTSLVTQISGGQ